MFSTRCHCDNVQISCTAKPETITRCNCSICHRLAADWAYFTPEQVLVSHTQQPTQTYCWGDKQIDFHHCPVCGCTTHYTTRENCASPRVGINVRLAPRETTASMPIRKFDGADSWRFIDEQEAEQP